MSVLVVCDGEGSVLVAVGSVSVVLLVFVLDHHVMIPSQVMWPERLKRFHDNRTP